MDNVHSFEATLELSFNRLFESELLNFISLHSQIKGKVPYIFIAFCNFQIVLDLSRQHSVVRNTSSSRQQFLSVEALR